MIREVSPKPRPPLVVEEVTDPEHVARLQESSRQAQANMAWLQEHWSELLPHGLGKYLAVAGQQAFLASTLAEAVAMAREAHPEDTGMFVKYLRPVEGARIYANRG